MVFNLGMEMFSLFFKQTSSAHDLDAPNLPEDVDTGVVEGIVFDFAGIQDDASLTQTSNLNQYLNLTQGFDFGPGVQPRNAANAGNEFNVTGFAGNGTSLNNAIANQDYLVFQIAPVQGIEMQVDQVAIQLWRNGSGAAREYALLASFNGFQDYTVLDTLSLGANNTATHVMTGQDTSGTWTTGVVEFRLYGWDQEGAFGNTHFNAVSMDAQFRSIDLPVPDSTGRINILGDYCQLENSTLTLQLGGDDNSNPNNFQYDQLTISGTAKLGGSLIVELENNYIPKAGDSFTLIQSQSLSGEFDTVELPLLGGCLEWFLISIDNELRLFAIDREVLNGDVNLDGLVNLLDVGPFIMLLTSGNYQCEADINGDGTVNLLDVGPFIELLSN